MRIKTVPQANSTRAPAPQAYTTQLMAAQNEKQLTGKVSQMPPVTVYPYKILQIQLITKTDTIATLLATHPEQ